MKTALAPIALPIALLLYSGCAHLKFAKKPGPPHATPATPATPAAHRADSSLPHDVAEANPEADASAKQNPAALRATGQSTGLKLFGFIPLWNPSPENARTSLYSAIGRHPSDSTIALEKQSLVRSESQYFLFSIPRISLSAEIARSIPQQPPTGDPADIQGAPLRKGIPVFQNP